MQPISLCGKFKNGCIELGTLCSEENNEIVISEKNAAKVKPENRHGLCFPLSSRKLKVGDVFFWELVLKGGYSINIRDSGPQILYHFNPRPLQTTLVQNTHVPHGWQWEDNHPWPALSTQNYKYTVRWEVFPGHYEISINNGQMKHNYNHRLHIELATMITMDGVMDILKFETNYPEGNMAQVNLAALPSGPSYQVKPLAESAYALRLRATGDVMFHFRRRPLKVGDEFQVKFQMTADRFSINFRDANNNILYHYNPRLNQGELVQNTCKAPNGWGWEENYKLPKTCKLGATCVARIVINQDHYAAYLDGQLIAKYKHRMPIEEAVMVSIDEPTMKVLSVSSTYSAWREIRLLLVAWYKSNSSPFHKSVLPKDILRYIASFL